MVSSEKLLTIFKNNLIKKEASGYILVTGDRFTKLSQNATT